MIRIENATSADAEALLALQKRAYQSEAELYGDWKIPPLTQSLAELRQDIETMTVLKASVAFLQRDVSLAKLGDDALPTALRAVGRPQLHAQRARRATRRASLVAPHPVSAVAPPGAQAHPRAHQRPPAAQVVGLRDAAVAVRADVAHGVGQVFVPLESVGYVGAAPH